MSILSYNGCGIIPAGLVSIQDEPILAGNQQRIGTTYRIQIDGSITNFKGSPASTGYAGGNPSANWGGYQNQFWLSSANGYPPDETNPTNKNINLHQIISKQKALRELFSTEGQWLEITPLDGSSPLKLQPKNISINFPQGQWFNVCPYTISAEADILYLYDQVLNSDFSSDLIQNASETWQIQPADVIKTFSVNHTVSAVGKRVFDATAGSGEVKPAWQIARDFVNTKLVLGWTGTSTISPNSGQGIFLASSLGSGVINFSGYNPYNWSRTEDVDELGGSYSVTESWITSPSLSGSHLYTVSTRRIVDDPYCTVVSNIQGTIHGYYDGLFNYDQRLASASYFWFTQLAGPTGLLNLITSTYSGYQYNTQPRAGSLDYNQNDGTINYQYEFSNQLYQGDAFDQWTVSRKTSADNYISTYGIAGTIKGRRYDGDTDVKASFNRAYVYFASLSGNNYNGLYQRLLGNTYYPEASGLGLKSGPITKDINLNEAEGIISYSLEFNNRFNDYGSESLAQEEFQISQRFDADQGLTIYNIQGDVKGLNTIDVANPRNTKFNNALTYYSGNVYPNLYNRISTYYGVSLPNPNPQVKEVSYFPVEGHVSYSFEYRNIPLPILPGVLSEHITISEENSKQTVNVIAQIPIPGRGGGSILQDVGTTTPKYRTLSLEAVITPTGGSDLGDCIATKPDYSAYIVSAKPTNAYVESDSENYSWKDGHYSRVIRWLYE